MERYRAFSAACAAVAVAAGASALTGEILGVSLLTRVSTNYYPMSAPGAVSFMLLGLGLLAFVSLPENSLVSRFVRFAALLPIILGVAGLLEHATGSEMLGRFFDASLLRVSDASVDGRISPVTSLSLIAAGIVLQMLWTRRGGRVLDIAAILSISVFFTGYLSVVGYVYDSPFLYGLYARPVSLLSGLSMIAIGAGTIAAAGSDSRVMRMVSGTSIRSRLTQIFMPFVVFLTVLVPAVIFFLHDRYGVNAALVAGVVSVLLLPATVMLVAWIARATGSAIDRAFEERDRAAAAVTASEEKYRALFATMTQGVLYLDQDGCVIASNNAAQRIVGLPAEQLEGRSVVLDSTPVLLEDGFEMPLKDTRIIREARGGQQAKETLGIYNPLEERFRWVDVSLVPQVLTAGRPPGMIVTFADVTERLTAERSLKESEERIRALVESAASVILIISPSGEILEFNSEAEHVYGCSREEALGQNYFRLFLPDDGRAAVIAQMRRVLEGQPLRGYTSAARAADGSEIMMQWTASRLMDGGSRPVGIVAVGQDMTSRLRIEAELKEERDRAQSYLDIAGTIMLVVDGDQNVTLINRRGCEILGRREDEVVGRNWFESFVAPAYRDPARQVHRAMMEGGFQPYEYAEIPVVNSAGEELLIAWQNSVFTDADGNVTGALSSGEDISERRKAERALQASEAMLRRAQQVARIGNWHWNIEKDEVVWSDELSRILGMHPDEKRSSSLQNMMRYVLDEDLGAVEKAMAEAMAGSAVDLDLRIIRAGGEERVVHIQAQTEFDKSGAPLCLDGIMQDITDRVRMQIALQESEGKFRNLVAQSTDGILIADDQMRIVEWNRGQEVITGLRAEDVIGKPLADVIRSMAPSRLSNDVVERMQTESMHGDAGVDLPPWMQGTSEREIEKADGSQAYIQFTIFPITTERGVMSGGITRDITERVNMERELSESEERYRSLIETSPDDIAVVGIDGKIKMVNQQAAFLHNYESPEEMIGMDVTDIVAPEDMERMRLTMARVIAGEKAQNLQFSLVRSDGTRFPVEANATLERDAAGNPVAFVAIVRDITERKKDEDRLIHQAEALQDSNKELATLFDIATTLGQEIDLEKLLESALVKINELSLFGADAQGGIFVVEGENLRLVSHLEHSKRFLDAHCSLRVGDCLCGLAAQNGEIIVSEDCRTDERHCISYEGMEDHGHVIVPLKTADRVVGVLYLYTPANYLVGENKIKLLEIIGSQLAVAIENAKLFEETRKLSLHDQLTGLANRNLMNMELDKSLARSRRTRQPFAVAMLDLDHFKDYNDSYGHTTGDKLLAGVAKTIQTEIREVDLAVRYGGEEFLLILPDTGIQEAGEVAERIRKKIEEARFYYAGPNPTRISVSVGLTVYDGSVRDKDDMVKRSDDALYAAKRNGRNRVEYWKEEVSAA